MKISFYDEPHFKGLIRILKHFYSKLHEEARSKKGFNPLLTVLDTHLLDLMLSSHKDYVSIYTPEHFTLYAKGKNLPGLPHPEYHIGKMLEDLFPQDIAVKIWESNLKAAAEGKRFAGELFWQHAEEKAYFSTLHYPLRGNEDEELLGYLVFFKDITHSRTQLELLQDSQYLLEAVFDTVKTGICITDKEGLFVKVNKAFCETYGYAENELLGQSILLLVPESSHAAVSEAYERFIDYGELSNSNNWRVKRKDGELITVEVTSALLRDKNGQEYNLTSVKDVTVEKEAEEKLKRQDEKLKAIQRIARLGSFELFLDEKAATWEPGDHIEHILGLESNKNLIEEDDLLNYVHQKNRDVFFSETSRLLKKKGFLQVEDTLLHKSGKEIPVLSTLQLAHENGNSKSAMVIVQDVTELKNVEKSLRVRNQQLLEANNRLNLMMKVLSHDFQAPLNSALSILELMNISKEVSEGQEYRDLLNASLMKMKTFANDLLEMARDEGASMDWQPVNLPKFIKELFQELNFDAGQVRLELSEIRCPLDEPFVTDPRRLKVILSNLLSNSIKYADVHKQNRWVKVKLLHQPGQLQIVIEDNGIGIREEHIPRLFELYFVVNKGMKSTGIGLYLVKQMLEKLGGSIAVDSTYGEGTTFVLQIPYTFSSIG